jgi:hypothetical protein
MRRCLSLGKPSLGFSNHKNSMLHIALAALVQTALVPGGVSPNHQPAALDTLLASKEYKKLGATIQSISTREDLRSDLDWLKDKMMSGETAYVTMLYARLLWEVSDHVPPEQQSQLKQTAAMATLYAYAAIQIDGTRCGDRSAPAHRLEQLTEWNPKIWPFVASLPGADKSIILKLVPLLERRTAARRDQQGDVEFLCRDGLEEIRYHLSHGGSREVAAKPGQIGRRIEVYGDGKYKPSERSVAEWKPEADKRRAGLPATLAALVERLSNSQSPR